MTISSVGPPASVISEVNSALSGARPSAPTVGYDEFLQLLIAEIQNQDPTAPTDPTQYMSQLSSFSTVAQQVQTNATLDALLSAQATNFIGKTVTSADGKISGVVVSVTFSTGGGAIATLEDGRQVILGPGVTISAS
ncbi:MAG: flagellar hook assembly protein FlgD [Beijerinckiaceae bacterium]|nr:flagellar hook assembly protein FlgD [Beijerinckiaceae bacterium]